MKIKNPFARLVLRWLINSLGLWMASRFFNGISFDGGLGVLLTAGFVLAIVNALIRPILIMLSLPAILLSLGLFTLVVNGATVSLVHVFYKPFHVQGLSTAILAGLTISLVNYLVTTIIEA